MAYDPRAENLMHLERVATGLFDFTGRSRRTELLVFVAAMAAVMVLVFILSSIVFRSSQVSYGQYLQITLWSLGTPLFARRLHDQDRTGWLAIILPILLGFRVYEQAQFDAGKLSSPDLGFPYNVMSGILVIAFWVLAFWPGTEGENRFGADPRQVDEPSVR